MNPKEGYSVDGSSGRRLVFYLQDGDLFVLVGEAVEKSHPDEPALGRSNMEAFKIPRARVPKLYQYIKDGRLPYSDNRGSKVKKRHEGRNASGADVPITEAQQKGLFKLHARAVSEDYAVFMYEICANWSKAGAKKETYYLKARLDARAAKKAKGLQHH